MIILYQRSKAQIWSGTSELQHKMSKVKVKCVETDCDWVSEEAEQEMAKFYPETHAKIKNIPAQPLPQPIAATLNVWKDRYWHLPDKLLNRRITNTSSISLTSTKVGLVQIKMVPHFSVNAWHQMFPEQFSAVMVQLLKTCQRKNCLMPSLHAVSRSRHCKQGLENYTV